MSSPEQKNISDFYDNKVVYNLNRFITRNTRVDLAFETIHSATPANVEVVIEIGCGIGEVAYRMARSFPNSKVYGFDISPSAVATANKLFSFPGLSYKVSSTLEDIFSGFENSSVDVIFMVDVFEHFDEFSRNDLINNIGRILKKNGSLILTCPTPEYQHYLYQNHPELLQPVDECITLRELQIVSEKLSLPISFYQIKTVWRERDYFHVVFSHNTLKWFKKEKSNWQMLKGIIKGTVIKQKKAEKEYFDLNYVERKNWVKNIFGKEFCQDHNLG